MQKNVDRKSRSRTVPEPSLTACLELHLKSAKRLSELRAEFGRLPNSPLKERALSLIEEYFKGRISLNGKPTSPDSPLGDFFEVLGFSEKHQLDFCPPDTDDEIPF